MSDQTYFQPTCLTHHCPKLIYKSVPLTQKRWKSVYSAVKPYFPKNYRLHWQRCLVHHNTFTVLSSGDVCNFRVDRVSVCLCSA